MDQLNSGWTLNNEETERDKGTSSSNARESIITHKTVVESDYVENATICRIRRYDAVRRAAYNFIGSAGRPSFSRTPALKCAEVGDTKVRPATASQRKLIVRPRHSEDQMKATDCDEEILEEEAVCKFCFEKLNSDDKTLKTYCGCASEIIHEKCVAHWCRVIYDNNSNCDTCGKEVQKLPISLINDLISVKSESSKWSWFSWLKR